MSFAATWIDLEIVIMSEISQRKTNIIWYCLYVESKKKNGTNKLIYRTEIKSEMQEDFSCILSLKMPETVWQRMRVQVASGRWEWPLDESQQRNGDFRPAVTQESSSPRTRMNWEADHSSAPRQESRTADIVISASLERRAQLHRAWAQDLQNSEPQVLLSCWVCGHLSCSRRKRIHVGTFTT